MPGTATILSLFQKIPETPQLSSQSGGDIVTAELLKVFMQVETPTLADLMILLRVLKECLESSTIHSYGTTL